jgi:hypothetical protein
MTRVALSFSRLVLLGVLSCTSASNLDSDQDGIKGGDFTFAVSTSDTAFSPSILKTQNLANVTVMFTNIGTKPHGFRVDGIDGATLAPVAPKGTATVKFMTPDHEAIYTIGSTAAGDTLAGQLIVN